MNNNELLQTLGINLESDIPTELLLSENFNAQAYGLKPRQVKKINALRNIITVYNQSIPLDKKVSINQAKTAAEMFRPVFRGLGHEECWVLYLNRANHPIAKERISSGCLYSTAIDVQNVMKSAILNSASGIILFHNHPSGSAVPGTTDIQTTKIIDQACRTLEMKLLDHIIITDSSFYSFNEESVTNFK